MIINTLLDDIIDELETLKPITQPSRPIITFVPTFKVDEIRFRYKEKLYDYFINRLQDIKLEQDRYDHTFQENLYKRKEYVTKSLETMKSELESEETVQLKNIKSKIDFIKSQGLPRLQKIKINKENSLKIFSFLSKIPLENEFKWMEDFLKRKIIFEVEMPSELEVINLRKMVNFIQSSNGSSM